MITVLAEGQRTAAKPHQCYHCYRSIGVGEQYGYQTCKYDTVYTLRWHLDCEAMSAEIRALAPDLYWGDEGWPPLMDYLTDCGEYEAECDRWRGFYPHVVARMELNDQLSER
jgi:hypothetical protein